MSEPTLLDEIESFNAQFEYTREDELEFWLEMLIEQTEEIQEHLDNNNTEKALDEFVDCIFVSHQPLRRADRPVSTIVRNRMENINSRIETVQDTYERALTDSNQ